MRTSSGGGARDEQTQLPEIPMWAKFFDRKLQYGIACPLRSQRLMSLLAGVLMGTCADCHVWLVAMCSDRHGQVCSLKRVADTRTRLLFHAVVGCRYADRQPRAFETRSLLRWSSPTRARTTNSLSVTLTLPAPFLLVFFFLP
jgi:hypothetical protein